MASTLSSGALGLEKPATGEQAGTWGSQTNVNMETGLEIAIAGTKDIAVTAADVTLTVPSGTSITDIQSRAMALNITGTLTGNRAVIVPAKSKSYIVKNSGSGDYTLTVKTAAGSGVIVSRGDVALLYCDGTDVIAAPSAAATHAATTKATPVDADEIPLVDSATTNQWIPKKLTWANMKTTMAAACSAGWNALTSSSCTGNAATATTATSATTATTANRTDSGKVTVASHATTGDIFAAAANTIDWTGTATTTAFPAAAKAGMTRRLICADACLFTAGANLLIEGIASGNTITLAANVLVDVTAITTTQFKMTYNVSHAADYQVFTANGTWTKPAWVTASMPVLVEVWGAGGGGYSGNGGAGGGGAYNSRIFTASDLGATVAVTVAPTTSTNAAGGSSSFGSHVVAYGGGAGAVNGLSGGGGGSRGVGANGGVSYGGPGGLGYSNTIGAPDTTDGFGDGGGGGGGGSGAAIGGSAFWGGGGGGTYGGASMFGGGGGRLFGGTSAGVSLYGGNGGTAAGTAPGGGGGSGASSTGGRGEVRVRVSM